MADHSDNTHNLNNGGNKTKWEELSPAIQALKVAFETHQMDKNKGTFLVFYDMWFSSLNFHSVNKGENVWAERERLTEISSDRYHVLLMALDLDKPLLEQIPAQYHKTLNSYECFAQTPLISVPDGAGRIPSEERDAFLREALWPKPKCVHSNPNAVPPMPVKERPRNHLRLV